MVTIKSDREVELMRKAGQVLAKVHKELSEYVRPGLTTKDIDERCEKLIRSMGAVPGFKGYAGFPASACVSVNDEVIHGIPSADRVIEDGDIVSIDTGVILNGWQSDAARTHAVGDVDPEVLLLIERTRNSFFEGIKKAVAGGRVNDIGAAVEEYLIPFGYGIVEDYVGHGIGKEMHEDPEVPNYTCERRGLKLQKNMTLAVEPMINLGTWEVSVLPNEWTVVTNDGAPSAHYENTILVTDGEPEVLSLLPEEKKLYHVK